MKNPTEIKNKIKQIKFEYLKTSYAENLVREPYNCVYNRPIKLLGDKEVLTRVCTYFTTDEESYQICNSRECSQQCNAFVFKHDKKQLRELLDLDVEANPKKYPELMVLEWVLDSEQVPPSNPNIIRRAKTAIVYAWLNYISPLGRFFV